MSNTIPELNALPVPNISSGMIKPENVSHAHLLLLFSRMENVWHVLLDTILILLPIHAYGHAANLTNTMIMIKENVSAPLLLLTGMVLTASVAKLPTIGTLPQIAAKHAFSTNTTMPMLAPVLSALLKLLCLRMESALLVLPLKSMIRSFMLAVSSASPTSSSTSP